MLKSIPSIPQKPIKQIKPEEEFRNNEKKIVLDYAKLGKLANALRDLDKKLILTIGSWDMLHIGHLRYLMKAKLLGDVLIVGVDSDKAVKRYKGPFRPIIPENERMEMLSYQNCVDYITRIDDVTLTGKWKYALLKTLRPHTFVAVEDSYPKKQLENIQKHCEKLIVLPRQAKNTSTTNIIQNSVKRRLKELLAKEL